MTDKVLRAVLILAGFPILFLVVIFLLHATMFSWESCGEDDSHVKRMRSYSQTELAELHEDLMNLREIYPNITLLRSEPNRIPANLRKLRAVYIDVPEPPYDVFVALNKCNISVGVKLHARSGERNGRKELELTWYNPTKENLDQGSEILLSEEKVME